VEAIRFATPNSLELYSLAGTVREARGQQLHNSLTLVNQQAALEESFFLGLRMNRGISRDELCNRFGPAAIEGYRSTIDELNGAGLLEEAADRLRLTPRGRLLSNEVFEQFLRCLS
jgi:oxygen-independent coproporphyrinogen-3 oxidase